jgi:acetolactate synthase-1/2/3 large subunit
MKCSDYIVDFIGRQGVRHVFTVSGAGNVHILDSLRRGRKVSYFCNHHEQACAMAMYAYSRATENFGVCLVTTGPGGTNALTGVCSAWVDSIPGLVISGQVKRADMSGSTGTRQRGIQEINIVDIVRPVTKYAATVCDPREIRRELEKAVCLAKSGRPGPSWLDIPLDVQTSQIDPETLPGYAPPAPAESASAANLSRQAADAIALLRKAERPVLLLGHGIRIAKAIPEMNRVIESVQIPLLVSWNAIDLLPSDHPLYVGRFGIYGQRGANFAVQNCDFLLSIGSRLSVAQVGYNYRQFARSARKVYVDIDPCELRKFTPPPDIAVAADAKAFLKALWENLGPGYRGREIETWRIRCRQWRENYPVDLPEYAEQEDYVNCFTFLSTLSDELAEDEIIVPTASGSGFTSAHQTLRIKKGQRCFTSNGFAEMGFDLPGAIGASVAMGGRRVVTVTGDGGVQMNLQELQTIVHHQLPIKLFILNNQGYLTIRHTENALFNGQQAGTGPDTGVSLPDMLAVGRAYGIKTLCLARHERMRNVIREVLDTPGPVLCVVVMDPNQPLVPKTSFRQLPDGRLVSPPLEDLYPFLPRDEFAANMIIPSLREEDSDPNGNPAE